MTLRAWDDLSHSDKMQLFATASLEDIAAQHKPAGADETAFLNRLYAERDLWQPASLGKHLRLGSSPTKDMLLASGRDLNRIEAVLEMTDNSIDAWMRRHLQYPDATPDRLKIYIDYLEPTRTLRFEDNAGGVRLEHLQNLVIPGYSETQDVEATIGSYRTGGKKAVFTLAEEANIVTSYVSPVGAKVGAVHSVHLDDAWLQDPHAFEFDAYEVKGTGGLEPGQTVYILKLHDHVTFEPDDVERLRNELQRTYALLLARNPIDIYLMNRATPLSPSKDLYKFAGTNEKDGVDIRPRQVFFTTNMSYRGASYVVRVEVVLGCRRSLSATSADDDWGVDLYGNNRLFRHHDQDEVPNWFSMPSGQARQYLRGLINITGPNVFVPWDTHKRHLNSDREIVRSVLRAEPRIRALFSEWKKVYSAVSADRSIRGKINVPWEPWKYDNTGRPVDLNVVRGGTVDLTKKAKAADVPGRPTIGTNAANVSSETVTLSFRVTKAEFRDLCVRYDIDGDAEDKSVQKLVAESVKQSVVKKR